MELLSKDEFIMLTGILYGEYHEHYDLSSTEQYDACFLFSKAEYFADKNPKELTWANANALVLEYMKEN